MKNQLLWPGCRSIARIGGANQLSRSNDPNDADTDPRNETYVVIRLQRGRAISDTYASYSHTNNNTDDDDDDDNNNNKQTISRLS